MNAPRKAETAPCAPEDTPADRARAGYNAEARLAGPNLNAFTQIAQTLTGVGLSAPQVFAADAEAGFALIEDLGDDLFARAIPGGAPEEELYRAAIDVLIALRAAAPPPPATRGYTMLSYDDVALASETRLVVDWYWKHRKGADPAPDIRDEYAAVWAPALSKLRAPSIIVLRDYHAENLLWLPSRRGVARVGLIDFQDGLVGDPAYDLVSLLEDARRDVAPAFAEQMIAYYCSEAKKRFPDFDETAFRSAYAILAAQRNAKILGVFARLIDRDGKKRYADFFPRVERYFRHDLQHPDLIAVRGFFSRHFPELAA
jgi:aminoglycoside/choline kinase family phosphotransferase